MKNELFKNSIEKFKIILNSSFKITKNFEIFPNLDGVKKKL